MSTCKCGGIAWRLVLGAMVASSAACGAATRPAGTAPATMAIGPASRPASQPATRITWTPTPKPSTAPAPLTPATVAELRDIEQRVQEVVKKTLPAVVGVLVGNSQGSGVIISPDGYVLTAAHVVREPGLDVTLILPDGRRVKAKTLGADRNVDAGLIKITTPGPWPTVEVGKSGGLKRGEWVAALGHPGGYRRDRPPVLRLGRVLTASDRLIDTDCTLVGGDSGGPLFDLDGRVVGIHSRIGGSAQANIHVPVDSFVQGWGRLAMGEAWGGMPGVPALQRPTSAILGFAGQDDPLGCRIIAVTPGTPAEKLGLQVGDVFTKFEGLEKPSLDRLVETIGKKRPGDEVKFQILRGRETLNLAAKLMARP